MERTRGNNLSDRRPTRRDFLRSAGTLAGASALAVACPAVGSSILGANDTIGVGFIGVGGRGMSHVATVEALSRAGEKVRIVAVCDAYGPRLRSAAEKVKARAYSSTKEGDKTILGHAALLEDKEVDAVCIATPDRLHVPQALDAIRKGKDVYCEKPMGHWTQFGLAKKFFEETRKLGRVVQIGNQGNSSNFWRKVVDLIKKGTIGKPQVVQAGFYRYGDWGERMHIPDANATPGPDLDWEAFLGDAPKVDFDVRRFFSWRMFLDYAGGPCTDLFPHVYTPFVSALGLQFPSLVASSGGIFKYDDYGREVPDTFNMCMDYPQRCSVVLVCTLANEHMTEPSIRGDEGTITLQGVIWEQGCDSITVFPRKGGKPEVIPGEKADSTRDHWLDFLKCVRSREKPVSDVEFGYHVQTAFCMAMLGFLNKKVARFDTVKEEIVL
jgi:predicted dehydrogenase